jgi:membrane protease YdiL (CAAX protease family)
VARVLFAARAVGVVVGFYAVVLMLAVGLSLLVPASVERWNPILVRSGAVVVAALLVGTVISRATDWSWGAQGWPGRRDALVGFETGLVVGLGLAAAVVVGALILGARVRFTGGTLAAIAFAVAPALAGLLTAALAEELLFRGFPLARLSAEIGKVPATLTLAGVFAALHWDNPGISAVAVLNIALAGVVLSAAFFGPGGLAAAWGLHFGWNAGLGLVFEAPVSGLTFELPFVDFATGGNPWLTGGGFGPEGGILATVAFGLLLGVWRRRFRPAV